MKTYHIHITGRVQGVGFRPFIYNLAKQYQLLGWVSNTLDGVHITFNSTSEESLLFQNAILENNPRLSQITSLSIKEVNRQEFRSFEIRQSQSQQKAKLLLAPDFAVCVDCLKDLNYNGRRQNYAFTTCTNCGPRFSITTRLPYDRITTTMAPFKMCPACQTEYNDPEDRRFYSQTNSCPACRISLQLFDSQGKRIETDQDEIINIIVQHWNQGKIIALKGIGGYLLTCLANNKQTIQELRKRKRRRSKPFALMYPDVKSIKKDAFVSDKEMYTLTSPESPIVLLKLKSEPASNLAIQEVAPGLDEIGVMLPYTPLFDLLLKKLNQPIIATSGNSSNAPIVYQNEQAISSLSEIADLIVANDRKINFPQDDSVIKFSPLNDKKIIYRRSRGLAPSYFNPDFQHQDSTILAVGADLKSSFTISYSNNFYISQYIGDLESFDTQQSFNIILNNFLKLLEAKPDLVLADKHPNYFSTQLADDLAQQYTIPIYYFQHHIAHFAAVLGENNLINNNVPVLGIIWDGVGFGLDEDIWGGEFFVYQKFEFERVQHFGYFSYLAGDKMSKEPRIAALSLCHPLEKAIPFLKEKFTTEEWNIYNRLLDKEQQTKTSSMGRIFDAIASLLDLKDKSSFEGEAAMLLEALAWKHIKREGIDFNDYYSVTVELNHPIRLDDLLQGIIEDLEKKVDKSHIAARFHISLIKLIEQMAKQTNIRQLAFSGGVFQNSLLVDLIINYFEKDYKLYFHQELSPNDENISFGQLVCYQIDQLRKNQ